MERWQQSMVALVLGLFCGAVPCAGQDDEDPFAADKPASEKGSGSAQTIEATMKSMIIPSVEFEDTPLDIALEFLRVRSWELDVSEPDPVARGFNFVLKNAVQFEDVALTLDLSNVPFYEALKIVAQLSGASIRIDKHAVVFEPESAPPQGDKGAQSEPFEGESAAAKKLRGITIPSIDLADTPLAIALDFLQSKSMELDAYESDVDLKGINLRVEGGEAIINRRISISLGNVPLATVLRYVAELSDLEVSLENDSVVFKPRAGASEGGPGGK